MRDISRSEENWSRRAVIRQGLVTALGLNLGSLIWAREAIGGQPANATAGSPTRAPGRGIGGGNIRACILVFYYGGPSHLDTYDLKPEAPKEIRGEFGGISTSVPGLTICEHLPHMARVMHKVALVRSMHHTNRLHDSASTEALTGRQGPNGDREEAVIGPQYFPCYGSTVSYMRRQTTCAAPHAALPFVFHNVVNVECQGGGFLGTAYDPLQFLVDPLTKSYSLGELTREPDEPPARMNRRQQLLQSLDQRALANENLAAASKSLVRFYDKAYQLLDSESLRRAIDLSQESPATRARYGFCSTLPSVPVVGAQNGFAREMRGQNLLFARRLVEAGVPFVNVYDFRQQGQNWDAHADNFGQHKKFLLPIADQSLSALIEDLDQRGLLDSTLVVAMGEFGRTPRINRNGGRDHWPDCYSILLAGGGIRGGTVFGSSDHHGAYPATDPVSPADLAATIYWRFGIDPAAQVRDHTGRPFKLADGAPMTQLFG
jgi:Protein of unknown function (DUF1501)